MISVLVWGVYAYLMMPQRQDPIIPVVTGVIITPYPGAEAEKVEQKSRGRSSVRSRRTLRWST
jgi:multidrug efflux pump subunit AcrB